MRLRELSQTKIALGGNVTLSIVTDVSTEKSDHLFSDLWQMVFKFERQFSRFIPMSELSIFNRTTGLKTPITSEFRDILIAAKQQGLDLNGLYNPFVTPALQRAGYKQSALLGHEKDVQFDYSDRRVVPVGRLEIGNDWAKIPYGTAIDLGGCGKGYLADKLGSFLRDQPVTGYWLSLGGDIVTMGTDSNGKQITLGIQDAIQLLDSKYMIHSPNEHFAEATSGTFRRQGQDTSNSWHHIIDPATSQPADTDIRLATVCAGTGLLADVLASCAIILGSKKAPSFLKKHGASSALLQCINNDGAAIDISFGHYIKIKSSNIIGELQNA